jgi:hypothetical protein
LQHCRSGSRQRSSQGHADLTCTTDKADVTFVACCRHGYRTLLIKVLSPSTKKFEGGRNAHCALNSTSWYPATAAAKAAYRHRDPQARGLASPTPSWLLAACQLVGPGWQLPVGAYSLAPRGPPCHRDIPERPGERDGRPQGPTRKSADVALACSSAASRSRAFFARVIKKS